MSKGKEFQMVGAATAKVHKLKRVGTRAITTDIQYSVWYFTRYSDTHKHQQKAKWTVGKQGGCRTTTLGDSTPAPI